VTSLRDVTYVTCGSGYVMRDAGTIMATGIAAGAVRYCLQDLVEKADALPAGDLRDAWTEAARSMTSTLNEALNAHHKLTVLSQ
jgi:hypothetical protein